MAEVFKRLSFKKSPSPQFSQKDFDEATKGMSDQEVKDFHEKMRKMNQVLEDELSELELQKTKLALITNSGDLGTFDESRPSLKNMKRKSSRRDSNEDASGRSPHAIIQLLQEALEDRKFEVEALRKENEGLRYLKEKNQERLELYEETLKTTELSLQTVSGQLREAIEELGKKSLRIYEVEKENRELKGRSGSPRNRRGDASPEEEDVATLKAHIASLEKKNRNQQLELAQIRDYEMPAAKTKIGILEQELAVKSRELEQLKLGEITSLRNRIMGLESELTSVLVHANPKRTRTESADSALYERRSSREIRLPFDSRIIEQTNEIKSPRGSSDLQQRDIIGEGDAKSLLGKKVGEETEMPCDETSATADKVPASIEVDEEEPRPKLLPITSTKPVKPILRPEGKPTGHNRRIQFDYKVLLLDAALEGDLDRVQECLEKGVSVNSKNEEGLTALHSSSCNGHGPIVKFLIENGAEINAVDDDMWTPLHGAACFGEVAVTRYLVVHGANINAVNENNDTPLAVAVEDVTKKYLQDCMRKLKSATEVYTLYDFTAEESDELSFKRGDKLTISTSPAEREAELWWYATNEENRSGYVPYNYLSEYSPIPGTMADI